MGHLPDLISRKSWFHVPIYKLDSLQYTIDGSCLVLFLPREMVKSTVRLLEKGVQLTKNTTEQVEVS